MQKQETRHLLELARRPEEVDGVVVVLRQAGADGEDVGVEHDVLRVEADPLDENLVRPLTHVDLQGGANSLQIKQCEAGHDSTAGRHF